MMKTLTTTEAKRFLTTAATVASYYGFSPVEDLIEEHGASGRSTQIASYASPIRGDAVCDAVCFVAGHCAPFFGLDEPPAPRLFYHTSAREGAARARSFSFSLSAFGVGKPSAEAIIVRTMLSILSEGGYREARVFVNSMGDRDSTARFIRDAGAHLKKHAGDIPALAREALKSDVLRALAHLVKKEHSAFDDVPKTMEFLSDKSRKHLSEVLEYFETTETPYEIDSRVMGDDSCYAETVFEIRGNDGGEDDAGETICRGGRCDELARTFFDTKDASLVCATITLPFRGAESPRIPPLPTRKPKFFFIQTGLPARMRSLVVVEELRRANIPLRISLETEGLREQLEKASLAEVPYAILIGQREVLDGTALVRHLDTQAQEAIPIAVLPDHLKALR